MVFNDELIFIHLGKTGGLSCSKYLLLNLKAEVYSCHKTADKDVPAKRAHSITALNGVGRHCTLSEALAFIHAYNEKNLSDFRKVVAVIRHPFTLEYSYFKHLQKPEIRKQRKNAWLRNSLADKDFKSFVEKGNYHRIDHPQERFFLLDGEIPDIVELIKFENLAETFPAAVASFLKEEELEPFPYINRTDYQSPAPHITDEVKELIYHKHRYMFDSGLYSLD